MMAQSWKSLFHFRNYTIIRYAGRCGFQQSQQSTKKFLVQQFIFPIICPPQPRLIGSRTHCNAEECQDHKNHRIIEQHGLEGTPRVIEFQPPYHKGVLSSCFLILFHKFWMTKDLDSQQLCRTFKLQHQQNTKEPQVTKKYQSLLYLAADSEHDVHHRTANRLYDVLELTSENSGIYHNG